MSELSKEIERYKRLYGELDTKVQLRALRNTLRQEANKVKKEAAKALAQSGIHNASGMKKNILGSETKKLDGYYVTVTANPMRRKAMHQTQRGVLKPIVYWINYGSIDWRAQGKGKNEGKGFMDEVEKREIPKSAQRIADTFEANLEKQLNRIFR